MEQLRNQFAAAFKVFSEGLVYAYALYVIGILVVVIAPEMSVTQADVYRSIVYAVGAGVTEEVLFRVCILTGVAFLAKACGCAEDVAVMFSLLASTTVFVAAHGTQSNDAIVFRFIAGMLFGWLYVRRGFAVCASTHGIYDILVGLATLSQSENVFSE